MSASTCFHVTFSLVYAAVRTRIVSRFDRTDGGLVFRKGKHKGEPLAKIAAEAPDYLQWMLGADDMAGEVLDAVRNALRGDSD